VHTFKKLMTISPGRGRKTTQEQAYLKKNVNGGLQVQLENCRAEVNHPKPPDGGEGLRR